MRSHRLFHCQIAVHAVPTYWSSLKASATPVQRAGQADTSPDCVPLISCDDTAQLAPARIRQGLAPPGSTPGYTGCHEVRPETRAITVFLAAHRSRRTPNATPPGWNACPRVTWYRVPLIFNRVHSDHLARSALISSRPWHRRRASLRAERSSRAGVRAPGASCRRPRSRPGSQIVNAAAPKSC